MSVFSRAGALSVVAVCLASATVACGATSNNKAKSAASNLTIAGVYGDTSDPFWGSIGCGAKQEAKQLGVKLKLYTGPGLASSQFASSFSAAQSARPNGIFADPLVANQFLTQYKQLMKSGVPIVDADATSPAAQYRVAWTQPTTAHSSFIPQVINLIPKQSGTMAELGGVAGLVPVLDRFLPLVSAIHTARPQLKMLPIQYDNFDTSKAAQYVTSTLISHPDLKLIVVSSNEDALGVVNALKAAHKAGNIKVIAIDSVASEISALKAGYITALLAQQPKQIGLEQVKLIVDYLKAHKSGAVPPSGQFVAVPQVLLTKANLNQQTISKYEYEATASC